MQRSAASGILSLNGSAFGQPKDQMDSTTQAAVFLHFGFVPVVPKGFTSLPWSQIREGERATAGERSEADWIEEGMAAFRCAACS